MFGLVWMQTFDNEWWKWDDTGGSKRVLFLKKNMEHIVNIKSSKYQGFDNKENTNEINGAYQ